MITGRAWRLLKFGDPAEGIELQEATWPEPRSGQVLIRVRTAGAGFPDAMMAAGQFPLLQEPPFGLGEEAAGEVVAVPPGSRFRTGDRVAGITEFLTGWGGYADYAYLREGSTVRVPDGMTDEQAGGFPIGFRTAYAGLVERSPLKAGQSLLVLGAAGSSGAAAIQLGKALGAEVIAVAGDDDKLAFCARQGADHTLNHRSDDLTARIADITGGHGVDVLFDPVGGATAAEAVKSVAPYGHVSLIGFASGSFLPLDPADMLMRNYTVAGVLATPREEDIENAVWDDIMGLAGSGAITTPVGRVFDFSEVPGMIAQQATPPAGKSVVRVSAG
jgi:NADPH2:quinone reductase